MFDPLGNGTGLDHWDRSSYEATVLLSDTNANLERQPSQLGMLPFAKQRVGGRPRQFGPSLAEELLGLGIPRLMHPSRWPRSPETLRRAATITGTLPVALVPNQVIGLRAKLSAVDSR
jgi:hypothetical protein